METQMQPEHDVFADMDLGDLEDVSDFDEVSPDVSTVLSASDEVLPTESLEEHEPHKIEALPSTDTAFTDARMKTWMARLPDDVRDAFKGDGVYNAALSERLSTCLDAQDYKELSRVLEEERDELQAFGRPRRMRLVSMLARRQGIIQEQMLDAGVVDEEGSDGGIGGALGTAGVLFLEDIVLYTEKVLKTRMMQEILTRDNARTMSNALVDIQETHVPKI